jgi:Tfp pilus assembly protein FimT
MILIGVLAVVAVPKMNSAMSFRAVEFRDQTIAALRFAQKTATSHRRLVCVAFTSSSVTLTIDHDKSGACNGQALAIPGSNSNSVQGTNSSAVFASTPATLFFQPNGQGTDASGNAVTINTSIDGMVVYVAGATGYVGDAP